MKLRRRTGTGDVVDQRGQRAVGGAAIGAGAGGLGILGIIIALVVSQLGGGGGGFDLGQVLGGVPNAQVQDPNAPVKTPNPDDEDAVFVESALFDIQETWQGLLRNEYQDAKLVLFSGGVNTACGNATSAVGPFYCPGDNQVYIDLDFFKELGTRFGAPGDFAQAYVIAHEVGHHVQNLLGIDDEVRRKSAQDRDQQNELSVRQELQADCFAGVWGHSAARRGILEAGDLEEGLAAASAVGDDTLQRQAGVDVNPESWTHGSSEQRSKWFRKGFDSGNPSQCDTFSGDI